MISLVIGFIVFSLVKAILSDYNKQSIKTANEKFKKVEEDAQLIGAIDVAKVKQKSKKIKEHIQSSKEL